MPKNNHPELSIVIINYNVEKLLRHCLSSIYADPRSRNWEVIVVDNASVIPPKNLKKTFPKIILLLNSTNLGYARANNLAVRTALSDYLLFLNPDTTVPVGSIGQLISFARSHKHVGAIAPMLLNPDMSTQDSCYHLPSISAAIKEFVFGRKGAYLKYTPPIHSPSTVDSAVGACLLVPHRSLEQIGGWDERYFMYFEDLELAKQLKKACLDFWYLPQSKVIHIHGASSGASPRSTNMLKRSSIVYFGPLRYLIITAIIFVTQKLKK